jgi:biofilm PGA synthesis N-glycosyltransferase PgaC
VTGRFYIVGLLTIPVLPLTFLVVLVMYWKEKKIFNVPGLKVWRNRLGVVMFVHQIFFSPFRGKKMLTGRLRESIFA